VLRTNENLYNPVMTASENIALAYSILLGIQCLHSIEELSTGFHRTWYLFSMRFASFVAFEIVFLSFWIVVLLMPTFPYRTSFMSFFALLMFANGIQHLVWAGVVKKYVPGLATAPLLIIVFLWFYLGR
jgi:hypothetical protein